MSQSKNINILDLSSCDRIEVKYPGTIMPHGVLLVLSDHDFSIRLASANTTVHLGIPPQMLDSAHLDQFFPQATVNSIKQQLPSLRKNQYPTYLGHTSTKNSNEEFDLFAHQEECGYILELEAAKHENDKDDYLKLHTEISNQLADLQATDNWQDCLEIACKTIREISGFDTVLGVRFLPDNSQHALAESRNDKFPSYLDKRFPSSDTPEPARRQMLMMPFQYVPTIEYDPVTLLSFSETCEAKTLNLGRAFLRSISPVCNRFYRNIGAKARLVLTLKQNNQLWGYFMCWNASPRYLGYPRKLALQTYATTAGMILVEKEKTEKQQKRVEIQKDVNAISKLLAKHEHIDELIKYLPEKLIYTFNCSGAAICLDDQIITSGHTPSAESIAQLLPFLAQQTELFYSDRLPAVHTQQQIDPLATGIISGKLLEKDQYLIGFRKEWVQEVNWAGNPEKPVEFDANSQEFRLTPRGSFSTWREDIKGQSRPWKQYELEAFGNLISSILTQQSKNTAYLASEAKSRFLANMSHEIRSPMNAIIGLTSLCLEKEQESEKRSTLLKIKDSSTHLLKIINDILDLSKIETGKFQLEKIPFNIKDIIEQVTGLLDQNIRTKNLDFELILDALPSKLSGDPTRIRQILLNLMNNAIKFTDEGKVTLIARILEKNENSIRLRFDIRDTGIGLSNEAKARCFNAFEQADTSTTRLYGGTGLGLAVCKQLAELMNGQVGVESTPGLGSIFWFSVQLDYDDSPETAITEKQENITLTEAKAELRSKHNGVRILLVEDNFINQAVTIAMLDETGLEVDIAGNGADAVKMAEQQDYAAILMDMQMPVMNGLTATKNIRSLPVNNNYPIIALTANVFNEDRQACLEAGMNDFLSKPVEPIDLLTMLLKWLNLKNQ